MGAEFSQKTEKLKFRLGKPLAPQSFYSEANILTLIRLVLSLAFFILAILKQSFNYSLIGFFIHWLGDFFDGFYARKLKQETILGAEIDIIAENKDFTVFMFLAMTYAFGLLSVEN